MVQNRIKFQVKVGEKTLDLAVEKPSIREQEQAAKVYTAAFHEFLKAGAVLRERLDAVCREQKIWDDEKDKLHAEIISRLQENTKIVKGKVKGTPFQKAREAAIQMRRDRAALTSLVSEKVQLESNTAQGQAENRRFNYLVSACTKHADTGKPYFQSYDDFVERGDEPASLEAQTKFANLYYGHDPESTHKLPENEFLLRYGLCRPKDLHLVKVVNGKECPCDTEGRLMNEEGRYVNEKGELINIDGERVDENGEVLSETFPFLDEEGKEVKVGKPEEVKAAPPPPPAYITATEVTSQDVED